MLAKSMKNTGEGAPSTPSSVFARDFHRFTDHFFSVRTLYDCSMIFVTINKCK